MFGLSFGEFILLGIIAMVVVGPRNLPQMMRGLGRSLAKARRMANELREQSGIDEILRHEGIEKEMNELRKLASGRILDIDLESLDEPRHAAPPRSREYPTGGVDTFGALPEDAAPYAAAAREATGAPVDASLAEVAGDAAVGGSSVAAESVQSEVAAAGAAELSVGAVMLVEATPDAATVRTLEGEGVEVPSASAHDTLVPVTAPGRDADVVGALPAVPTPFTSDAAPFGGEQAGEGGQVRDATELATGRAPEAEPPEADDEGRVRRGPARPAGDDDGVRSS